MRTFTATFRLEIDENEGDAKTSATIEQLKYWLSDAIAIDVDTEEYGNPYGLQSAELHLETLAELQE